MVTEISVIVLLLIFLLFLIVLTAGKSRSQKKMKGSIPLVDEEKNKMGNNCPLCGKFLPPGERVHSHLYAGKPDGIMHIFGCAYCYEGHPQGNHSTPRKRSCPYCHDILGSEDHLIARVFEKPGKTQVHVLGCTICREKKN